MSTYLVPITDTYGNPVHSRTDIEPAHGSVVLTDGEFGTAWQRHFADGRWHPTRGGGSKTWGQLCARRNLVLVYDARERLDNPGADAPLSAERLGLTPVDEAQAARRTEKVSGVTSGRLYYGAPRNIDDDIIRMANSIEAHNRRQAQRREGDY